MKTPVESSIEKFRTSLAQKPANALAVLLLDLTPLLPESLIQRAILLARKQRNERLRKLLLKALAKPLPPVYRHAELSNDFPIPHVVFKQISRPAATKTRRLMLRFPEEQRYEVFKEILNRLEFTEESIEKNYVRPGTSRKRPKIGHKGIHPAASESEDWRSIDHISGIPSEPPEGQGAGSGAKDSYSEAARSPFVVMPEVAPELAPGTAAELPEEEAAEITKTDEQRDIVNLGFSQAHAADDTIPKNQPLEPETSYYFWVNIGYPHKDAIGSPTSIDLDKLPNQAILTVAIFGFENEIEITAGEDTGELKVQQDHAVKVVRQPTHKREKQVPLSPEARPDYCDDFLLFPIRTPATTGTYRLRCNIYCAQVLVQSYLLTAIVTNTQALLEDAFTKKLDYVLSESLRPGYLAGVQAEPHLLSIMINSNGTGAHNFRFFGTDGTELFKDDAQIDGDTLSGLLKQARGAMHRVSWGTEAEWVANQKLSDYRYQKQSFDRGKLAKDLAYLARAGLRIHTSFLSHLRITVTELDKLMTNSGAVQIALKLSPRAVLPAAVIYDYPWNPDQFDFEKTDFKLCPTFSAAIDKATQGEASLEECDCFKGGCYLKKESDKINAPDSELTLMDLPPMICPSGFWGYRHALGLPLTLDGSNSEAPQVINFKDDLQIIACVSKDPLFVERDPHLGRLEKLKQGLKFERDEGYRQIVKRLKKGAPHLLYFYCHGGKRVNSNLPYLGIGDDETLAPENITSERISWTEPHPLVFINGCHTTSLNPEIALDFVSSFVQQAHAAGVIGTEITIFEPLAAKFAEECLSRFLGAPPYREGMTIGQAVRGARLELLRQGNPLGLVYIPFSLASLHLQKVQQN